MNQVDKTEQIILRAAEEEFLEKGFLRTKTTDIAKRAGVNHAMLHYYFRTKENLFNIIFEQKSHLVTNSISNIFDSDLPFLEKIKIGIETHFDFLAENPHLPLFIFNEINDNAKRRIFFLKLLYSKSFPLLQKIEKSMMKEVEEGKIKYIKPLDLLLNVAALNVFPFIPLVLSAPVDEKKVIFTKQFLQERKENNIRIILNDLKK